MPLKMDYLTTALPRIKTPTTLFSTYIGTTSLDPDPELC